MFKTKKIERLGMAKFGSHQINNMGNIRGGGGDSGCSSTDATNYVSAGCRDEVFEVIAEDGTVCYRSVKYYLDCQ